MKCEKVEKSVRLQTLSKEILTSVFRKSGDSAFCRIRVSFPYLEEADAIGYGSGRFPEGLVIIDPVKIPVNYNYLGDRPDALQIICGKLTRRVTLMTRSEQKNLSSGEVIIPIFWTGQDTSKLYFLAKKNLRFFDLDGVSFWKDDDSAVIWVSDNYTGDFIGGICPIVKKGKEK